MTAWTLRDVEAAVRTGWAIDTCDDLDVPTWSPDHPASGQCVSTAFVLHDLLGGELLGAEVLRPDGSRQGYHYWNRLPGGIEVDLTLEQFRTGEVVQPSVVYDRPPGLPNPGAAQYVRLRGRVRAALGLDASVEVAGAVRGDQR